jgi:putative DNA methylase
VGNRNRHLAKSLFPESEETVAVAPSATGAVVRAIEDDSFPFEELSDVCEVESWRKEINRPVYHIHKWWAHRLGTAFRAIVLGTFAPSGADLMRLFYEPARIDDAVVFDPFMGSGTTLGETLKLGGRAIGRDINAVAHFLVTNALGKHDRHAISATFRDIERDVASQIRPYYQCRLPDGRVADVLYYFWVKTVGCPSCQESVDLFSSYVFAQHAYPKRVPEARALCPSCDAINVVPFDAESATCVECATPFDPQRGPARGQAATCRRCEHTFPIAKTIRAGSGPPDHRLYAKLVLLPDGSKAYLAATHQDRALYRHAESALATRRAPYPFVAIKPGYNTNQAIGYNYRHWHEMFNARQLFCLSILVERIQRIPAKEVRDLFACLLSGTLEFNNMFASYKGEGTGAVRHMFAHHILKPERVPLEANIWGTPKSSGAFSTLFEGRIRRALEYAEDPFELRVLRQNERNVGAKVFGLSEPIGFDVGTDYNDFAKGKRLYLSCGDSSCTDIPDSTVDAVITDPPFFDNVHYSQLADFFFVWQCHIQGRNERGNSTRSEDEVQNENVAVFSQRLAAVWKESARILKDDGLLVFTYHHSRPEGWSSILEALLKAGFTITAAHPIKAEMSVAMPKQQAKEPIDLDIILVCRKSKALPPTPSGRSWSAVALTASAQVQRLRQAGRGLSRNDIRVIVTAQALRHFSEFIDAPTALTALDERLGDIEGLIHQLHRAPSVSDKLNTVAKVE